MLDKKNKIKHYGAVYHRGKEVAADLVDVIVSVKRLSDGEELVFDAPAINVGWGLYIYEMPANLSADEDTYIAFFHTEDTTVNMQDLEASWTVGAAGVDFLDTPLSQIDSAVWGEFLSGNYPAGTAGWFLGNIVAPQVFVKSPVTDTGVIFLFKGDSYLDEEGSALVFTDAAGTWPNLDDGTVHFYTHGLDVLADIINPTGENKQVSVDITRLQTAAFTELNVDYALRYIRTNLNPSMLRQGGLVPLVPYH